LNAIISAAKRSWNYDPAYLAAALPLLMVDVDYLDRHPCLQAEHAGEPVGFAALDLVDQSTALLDHLWVIPEFQRRGIGSLLMNAALAEAINRGFARLRIISDPPAEGFYLRHGASRIGEKPSRISGGPMFPVLELTLPHRPG
jgi:GNAT superfamily N-acetyltransferase